MTFERRIFEQVCAVMPGMTTRTFSQLCGRSENYYCSVQSQNLQMPVTVLVHLTETLEHLKALGRDAKAINQIQQQLADEIANRRNHISSTSFTVQQLVAKAIARCAYERDQHLNVPPITMGWQ